MDEAKHSDMWEAAHRWYAGLQEALDADGSGLDLHAKEQTIRLVTFTVEELGDDDYQITPHYAMDPKNRAVDIGTIDDEEMLSRQQPDLPESAILRMYQAAQQGLLFLRDPRFGPRQVLVGEAGLPTLGNDYLHASPEEIQLQQIEEPPVPQEPDAETRAKAIGGDRTAERLVQDYERHLSDRQAWEEAEELRRQNPEKGRVVRNMVLVMQGYFQGQDNLYIDMYTARLEAIQTAYARSGLTPEERERTDYATAAAERAFACREWIPRLKDEGKLPLDAPLGEEAERNLAESLIWRQEQRRAEAWNTVRSGAFPKKTEAQIAEEVETLRQSPDFRQNIQSIQGEKLDAITIKAAWEVHGALDKLRNTLSPLPAPEEAAPLTMQEIGQRYRALHDRLKQDDSRWNWRNSDEYEKLLTALNRASKTFSAAEGYLDDSELNALRDAAAEVSERARDYRVHIGMEGKNARQQRRLEMTGEVLALTGDIFSRQDASRWNAVAEAHNEAARKAYYAEVRSFTSAENTRSAEEIAADKRIPLRQRYEAIGEAENRQELKEAEAAYEAAVQRTEALRARIEKAETEPSADESKRYLVNVDKEALKAREELTRMAVQKEMDPAKLSTHIAAVIAGTEMRLIGLPNAGPLFRVLQQRYENSPALKNTVKELTVKELCEFLTGPGEHSFTDRLRARMDSPLYAPERQQAQIQAERKAEMEQKKPELDEPVMK